MYSKNTVHSLVKTTRQLAPFLTKFSKFDCPLLHVIRLLTERLKNNSNIEKLYIYINAYLTISLGIPVFSFVGILPIIWFFDKQMLLNSCLENRYVFMYLLVIITSAIGAGYYFNLIK